MQELELQAELSRLRRLLRKYESEKSAAIREREELVVTVDELKAQANEIEGSLWKAMEEIERKLKYVNPNSRFPEKYRADARGRLMNDRTDNAIASIRAAAQKAQQKCEALDSSIKSYSSKISQAEREIQALQQRLSEGVEA